MRYTPQGTAVINFSVATNRSWKNAKGEVQDEVTFHRVVAWSKLAEICSQLLAKGRKVFVEGRLANRSWEGKDGQKRYTTEMIADELIILDSKPKTQDADAPKTQPEAQPDPQAPSETIQSKAPVEPEVENVPDEKPKA